MENYYKIYGLFDPRPEKNMNCFYVGQTKRGLKGRLSEHIKDSGSNRHKENIIAKILSLGLKPIIIEIDAVSTKEECDIKEIHWINYCENIIGWKLTNVDRDGLWNGYLEKAYGSVVRKQYSLTGEYIATYDNAGDAARAIATDEQDVGNISGSITSCCNNKHKTSHGYQWCNEGDEASIVTDGIKRKKHKHKLEVLEKIILKNIKKRNKSIKVLISRAIRKLPDNVDAYRIKRIALAVAYQQTDAGKISKKKGQDNYKASEKGQRKIKEYKQSDHYKKLKKLQKQRAYKRAKERKKNEAGEVQISV